MTLVGTSFLVTLKNKYLVFDTNRFALQRDIQSRIKHLIVRSNIQIWKNYLTIKKWLFKQ